MEKANNTSIRTRITVGSNRNQGRRILQVQSQVEDKFKKTVKQNDSKYSNYNNWLLYTMDCYLSAFYETIWKPRCDQIFEDMKKQEAKTKKQTTKTKKIVPNRIRKLQKNNKQKKKKERIGTDVSTKKKQTT